MFFADLLRDARNGPEKHHPPRVEMMRTDDTHADPLADLTELMEASSHRELQRLMVLRVPSTSEVETLLALSLFTRANAAGTDDAPATAILMATDPRWKSISRQVMQMIEDHQLLPDSELDLIAQTLIAADQWLYWECPPDWFDDEGADDQPAVARRKVAPASRRWAAARLTRREPSTWGKLFQRSTELASKHSSEIVVGLLEASDTLTPQAVKFVIERLLESGDPAARLNGLRRVAESDLAAARKRAAADRNGRVRAWAAKLRDPDEPPAEPETLF